MSALQRKPEHSFQAWLHKFLEAVVLEPREIRGFDKAGAARSVQGWNAAVARGVKDGTPDHLVVQGGPVRVLWIECKRPDGRGAPSPAQIAAANAYQVCGVPTIRECTNIAQALDGLRAAEIRISENAETVARLYQEHVDASERQRNGGAVKPKRRSGGAVFKRKPSVGQIARARKAGVWG